MSPLLALLLACDPGTTDPADGGADLDGGALDGGASDGVVSDGGASDGGASDPLYPTPALQASAALLDPTLDGALLDLAVELPDARSACTVELELVGEAGQLRRFQLDTLPGLAAWDGLDDGGAPFAPGLVTVHAWSDCADGSRGSATLDLAVVRLAPAELAFDGADAVPLAFHKRDLVTVDPVRLDLAQYRLLDGAFDDGQPAVPPWANPDFPPWQDDPDAVARNVPIGLVAGGAATVDVLPALWDAAGRPTLPEGVTVRLDSPAEAAWADASASFTTPPVEATAGVGALSLTWAWSGCLGAGCTPQPIPGSRTTAHTVYRLLGPSQLRDGAAEGYADGTPWIGTLHDTAAAVQGAADPAAVMDALRDRIYTDDWLVYDPSDSAYSDYDGAYIYWESITSQLSDWLDRRQGLNLYCHSVSCLLSTLAQTWGVDAEQIVLGVGFQTNLARAAGSDSWGRWYFNSHSVATTDGGDHIWDAAIDLDGDEDPYNSPAEPVSPKGMDGEEYLWRLTYDEIGIVNSGKCFVE